ncbi:MAG TPA: acid phosphatase [Ramlibacter sp.]|nr:acid phosphatase [Ramlibacter sp.]
MLLNTAHPSRLFTLAATIIATLGLGACAGMGAGKLADIDTVVVIYAENRSFDNLYGLFSGANGIANALANPASYIQLDRDGSVLPRLPAVWSASPARAPAWSFVASLPNKPFQINAAQPGGAPGPDPAVASPDLVHRFYNNQMQINGGKNDMYAAWSDAGGLAMGYYDGSSMAMWKIAQQYTLADNFFQGAFGGSFLNHFWLVCACTPAWDNPPPARISSLDASGVRLTAAANSPASALTGAPRYAADSSTTPKLADGRYYAVNTMQPSFQPSGTKPAPGGDPRLADPAGGGAAGSIPLPPIDSGSIKTIGDTLTAKNVPWAWYAGAWKEALVDRSAIYDNSKGPNFQPHHHPFNYFSRFDPTTPAGQAERAGHLKGYTTLIADIGKGTLPNVVFYKPTGALNQHPGYTDVMSGDAHVADLIAKLKAGPQWQRMAIIVTYDENGGFFDHVAPPKGDQWGPGPRIPTIIVSPYAKKGHVDHTSYDTTSIIKFITRRFGLDPLPGVRAGAGDLTNAFDFSPGP